MTAGGERARTLATMATRLTLLVEREIEGLKARRLDASSADWDEKEKLAHAWRLEVARLKADPAQLEGASPSERETLKAAARALEETLAAHALALAAMKEVAEGLVKAVAGELADARAAPAGYGRSGAMAGRGPAAGLTVNARA